MDIVLLFPGQGSQKAGMGLDLAEEYPEARRVFEDADRILGIALSRLCFEGPETKLTLTENAQPALLAHGAAVWAATRDRLAPHVRAAAGHSLGEFTAHHAAGTFTLNDALHVVRRRGELMAASGERQHGAMAAIMGLDEQGVEDTCTEAAAETGKVVVPANYNTAEQCVISGDVAAVESAMLIAKEKGAKRAIRLNVSGAFHSPLMASAGDGLQLALANVVTGSLQFPVFSNVSTTAVVDGESAKRLLREQLTSAVRWTEEVANIAAAHPGALYLEMGPGSVLSNLVKRIIPGAETMPCGTKADLKALWERMAA